MIDKYGRKIDYLRMSVTDRCNLRCRYCMPPEGIPSMMSEEILSYEELALISKVAVEVGISKIRITGGEPLVRKDLTQLITYLSSLPGLEDLSLTTNGISLAKKAADLKEAGLSRVNISLDSLRPEDYSWLTRGGDLSRVIEGIEASLEAGLEPVKVNVVALRSMLEHYDLFLELVDRLPVHVRFIEYMPIGKVGDFSREDFISAQDLLEYFQKKGKMVEARERPLGWGPAIYYSRSGAQGTIGFISPETRHFCTQCNRLRLTSDGKLKGCLFSGEVLDIKHVLREGKSEEALKEVLEKAIRAKPPVRESEVGESPMSSVGG